MVAIRAPFFQADIVVLHAPCATHGKEALEQWWLDTQDMIASNARASLPLYVLADTNAHIHRALPPHFGGLAVDQTKCASPLFEKFVTAFGCWGLSQDMAHPLGAVVQA